MSAEHGPDDFTFIRDTYFRDPQQEPGGVFTEAATTLLEGLVTPDGTPIDVERGAHPLVTAAADIAESYRGQARHFDRLSVAQLHPAGNYIGELAHIAATARNNNTIVGEVSPLETELELRGVRWLLEHVAGYEPDEADGALVSGGSMANLTALLVARAELEADGWRADRPATLFASTMGHYSLHKSARVLAPANLIQVQEVPLEPGGYRLDPAQLEAQVSQARKNGDPILGIVAVAGETETGLIDDLAAIAEIADRHDVRLHVDGAYGAPFRLSRMGDRLAAMSDSDSLTCDPHKYLYTPYPGGSVLFRARLDLAHLLPLNDHGANYMFKEDEDRLRAHQDMTHSQSHLGRRRIEGSAGGHAAAALYYTTKYIGERGIGALLDHTLDMTAEFAEAIGRPDSPFALSFEPELNTVCFELSGDNPCNNAILEQVSSALDVEGIYLTTTSLPYRDGRDGTRKVLRFVATHPYTGSDEVQHIATTLRKTVEGLQAA